MVVVGRAQAPPPPPPPRVLTIAGGWVASGPVVVAPPVTRIERGHTLKSEKLTSRTWDDHCYLFSDMPPCTICSLASLSLFATILICVHHVA